jgi:lysophospholipase L1-like esterase
VVIGASISQAGRIEQLPGRPPTPGFSFEAVQAWQFDKSALLAETLMRPARKPRLTRSYLLGFIRPPPRTADVIVLKECSAYFPGDASRHQQLVRRWVDEVRKRQIDVMLATVVPVTAERATRDAGKQAAVIAFNDWLREYASAEGIPLLDLEQATRISELDRHLRKEFDVGDGAHVNRAAYVVLDGMMAEKVKALTASAVASAP